MTGMIAAVLLLFAAATWFAWHPSTALWSLSNGADLAGAWRSGWLAVAAAALVAPLLLKSGTVCARLPSRRWSRPALVAAAALLFLFFVLLRSRNHFLGDGWLIITILERADDPIMVRPGMGTIWVQKAVFALARGVAEEWVIALVSCAAGAAFFSTVIRWSRGFAADRGKGAGFLLAAVPLTAGTMQLFFGYIENYALAHLFLLLFLVEGGLALLRKRGVLAATFWFLLSLLSHWAVAALFPALLFLWMKRYPALFRRIPRFLPEAGVLLVFLLPPTLAQAGFLIQFLPWVRGPGNAPYGIVSAPHLLLTINFLLLLAPAPLLLLAARGEPGGAAGPDDAPRFLRLATLCGVAFLFVVRPFLGPRDWDLVSYFVVPLSLWAPLRFVSVRPPGTLMPAAALVAGAGLFFLFPWVVGNRTVTGGAERVARMVIDDPHHYSGSKTKIAGLAWVMAERGAPETSFELYRIAAERRPDNAAIRSNLGVLYWQRGDYADAAPHLDAAVRLDPDLGPPLYYKGTVDFHLRRGDLGESSFRRFLERVPENPSAESYLGRVLMAKGDWEGALEHLRASERSLPQNRDLKIWIGRVLVKLERDVEALAAFRDAVRIDPKNEEAKRLMLNLEEGE